MSEPDDSDEQPSVEALNYYLKVFGGEALADAARETRESKLGQTGYSELRCGSDFSVEVDDADVIVARAALHGGRIVQPVEPRDDETREGVVEDPFGARWRLSSRKG
ncbi:MAG: VOC family protein [Pseudomonadota bacterium]